MDWVHCNRCYTQPGDVKLKKFFLTNCGHIYCDECLKLNQSNKCKICHEEYLTTPLSANMSREIEIYFYDIIHYLKKQIKISEFQDSHRTRLMGHYKQVVKNYKEVKNENYSLKEELKIIKTENTILKDHFERLKVEFQNYKNQFAMRTRDERSQVSSLFHCGPEETPRTPQFSRQCPGSYEASEISFNLGLKHPTNPNFFIMTESLLPEKNKKLSVSKAAKVSKNYRFPKKSTPKLYTPKSSDSLTSDQGDPLQKKTKLPSTIINSTRRGFQGISLTMHTSTPYKNRGPTNKYSKYFK